MTTLFWISLGTLAYIYAGYPVLVWVLARLFGREPQRDDITPFVSLLIPAYNEEAHIEAKLRNALALDYPRDRLKIVVASDGSTDETNAMVRRFARDGIRLVALPGNVGKSQMLNQVVPQLQTELVVFSDASSELEPWALRRLVRGFADPRVGCIGGLYRLRAGGTLRDEGEGLYWRYETFIKRQESRLHSILGGHGAFYAIRARLFRPLETSAINDDYLIPMRIVAQGYRAVYEPSAVAWERELASMEGEFARRRRIAAGNCQQIATLWRLLDPRRGWVALEFASHKVLRTFAPLFLLGMLAATPSLPSPLLALALLGQGLLYGTGIIGYLCQQRGYVVRWLSPSLYFCLGNLAMLAGLLKYCVNRRHPAWERARP